MEAPVHICIPTLKRYDLLHQLIDSLCVSTVVPTSVTILDNGGRCPQHMTGSFSIRLMRLHTVPWGLAECWNWALTHLPEERILVNDDCTFAPDSLERMVATPGAFVSALAGSNAFSCFLIRDECVAKVGLFDETISPGYAYFEDNDYAERMAIAKVPITSVSCGVEHAVSATLAAYTDEERTEHHRKFDLAKENFVRKWGRLPR